MDRRRLLQVGAALAASSLLPGRAMAGSTINMSTWLPPTHVLNQKVMSVWAEQVSTATEGRVVINTLPKAVAAPPGTFEAVEDGIVDIGFSVHGYTPGRFTLPSLAEFVGRGDSAEAASVTYQRVFDKHLAKVGEHAGSKVLAVFTNGPGHIFTIDRPITRVADLKGLRIRVGGGMVNDVADRLGVASVLKPATDSYELLSSGIVDGTFFPTEPIITFKLADIIRHGTLIPGGLYNTSWAVVMNQSVYDGLSDQDRQAIDSVSGEHLARLAGKAQDENDIEALEKARAAGIEFLTADAAFMAEIAELTLPLREQWIASLQAKAVDGNALLAAWDEELAAFTAS